MRAGVHDCEVCGSQRIFAEIRSHICYIVLLCYLNLTVQQHIYHNPNILLFNITPVSNTV